MIGALRASRLVVTGKRIVEWGMLNVIAVWQLAPKNCTNLNIRLIIIHIPVFIKYYGKTLGYTLHVIMKTRLYNFDPLKPHFYIEKLGFTGVYVIFVISAQNIYCGYSFEPPRRGGSNEYPQSMFWAEIWKISEFLSENLSFFGGKIFSVFE